MFSLDAYICKNTGYLQRDIVTGLKIKTKNSITRIRNMKFYANVICNVN